MAANDSPADAREFVISRTFDAPRERVWKAFTEAEHLRHWWGPKGCAISVAKLELRPGGIFLYCMRFPNGHEMWGRFVYREIVPPERLVFVISFSDAQGNMTRSPFSETWPLEVLNVVTLSERDGKTTLNLKGAPINATEAEWKAYEAGFESMQKGFGGTWDKFADYLAKT